MKKEYEEAIDESQFYHGLEINRIDKEILSKEKYGKTSYYEYRGNSYMDTISKKDETPLIDSLKRLISSEEFLDKSNRSTFHTNPDKISGSGARIGTPEREKMKEIEKVNVEKEEEEEEEEEEEMSSSDELSYSFMKGIDCEKYGYDSGKKKEKEAAVKKRKEPSSLSDFDTFDTTGVKKGVKLVLPTIAQLLEAQ